MLLIICNTNDLVGSLMFLWFYVSMSLCVLIVVEIEKNSSGFLLTHCIGFQASCVPCMGDGNASGQLHGMAERNNENRLGFPNLWRGTSTLGCARVVDSGYVHENRAGRGRARMNNNPNVQEWCEQVTN